MRIPAGWSDPRALREGQYATDANLVARQSIYAYQHPRTDLTAFVLDRAALRGDETVPTPARLY